MQSNLNTNTNLNQGAHHNPLDRNHDGKVNLKDLAPHAGANSRLNQGLTSNQSLNNPLDRNHDGRVDARDFASNTGLSQNTYVQGTNRSSLGLTRSEPVHVETVQKGVVVHEHIHPIQKEEIQPIIYREREQLDVKQVTQMLHETQIQPTVVQQRELAPEVRAAVVERAAPIAENYVAPSTEIDATVRSQVVHAPIINEVIKKTIVEEVQPVLERDVIQATVIHETQPIYEKFVDAPHVIRETRVVQDRGIVGGDLEALRSQGFNIGSMGLGSGVPQGSYTQTTVGYNPLDRNHDGRVDARDFAPNAGLNQGLGQRAGMGETMLTHHGLQGTGLNQQGPNQGYNQGLGLNQQGLNQQGLNQGYNQGLGLNQQGLNQGYNQGLGLNQQGLNQGYNQGLGLNQQGLNQGYNQNLGVNQQGLNQGAHHNPLDRNHDGKVNLKDLSGRPSSTAANSSVKLQ